MTGRLVFTGTEPPPCVCDEHLHQVTEVDGELHFVCLNCLRTVRTEPLRNSPARTIKWSAVRREAHDLLPFVLLFMMVCLLAVAAVIIALIIVYGSHHATTPPLER